MNRFIIFISILVPLALLLGCGNQGSNKKDSKADTLSLLTPKTQKSNPVLPPLVEGEISLTDGAFGPTINLKGEPINIKENIKPEQLFVKDKYLITKNQREDSVFMIFELPEMKCVAAFGTKGSGPNEFNSPQIIETAEDSIMFYVFDWMNSKVYKVSTRQLKPEYYFTFSKTKRSYDDRQLVFIDSKRAYYSAAAEKGKMIYSFNKDSLPQEKKFKDLAIPLIKGSWTTLIGDFGVNNNSRRMAYAYKYFKRLKVIDIESMKERNIVFTAKNLKKGLNDIATLEPTNITHFWGMSANDDYFWMLYSGRTPVDVYNDNRNNKKYIYVEKYDWNGNPVKRYKLDDWGYFCVDKKNETLFLASTASIYSLIKYNVTETAGIYK